MEWKVAVRQIFKTGERTYVNNYRGYTFYRLYTKSC